MPFVAVALLETCKHTLMCKIGAFQHAILNLYDLNLWALDKKADILGLDSDFLLFALLVALLVQTNEAGVEYAELSREKLLSYCLNAVLFTP